MAASEKTILSCMEEESSENKKKSEETENKLLEKGKKIVMDDLFNSKPLFGANNADQEIETVSFSILLQNGKPEDVLVANQSQKAQKCPSSLTNQSDYVQCRTDVVKSDLVDGVEHQVLSQSPQHEINLSETDQGSQRASSKSENMTLKDNSDSDKEKISSFQTLVTPELDRVKVDISGLSDLEMKQNLSRTESVSFDKEFVNGSGCSDKENLTGEVSTTINSMDVLEKTEPYVNSNENVLPSSVNCCTVERKPMYNKAVNIKRSSHDPIHFDPFTLSGDEDFSPKAYKPIKRKLSQGAVGLRASDISIVDDSLHLNIDKKRQRLIDEDNLSLTDVSGRKPVSVFYVYSPELIDKANKLIRIEGRAHLVHSLINIYGILQHIHVIPPRLATETEIMGFHCSEYIHFLKTMKDSEDLSDSISAEAEAYGLSYDCPVQEDVFQTASLISGATITAAESLINGAANIAINWCGGWHHAKRDSASGFCYMNDIVLGILKLREKFDKVLYVDLDLHHGDGVEEAFYMTPKVMTVSFHKYAFGFFPGSGSLEETGSGRGRLYSVNVPLMDGIGDGQFFSVFTSVMKKVREKFNADAIVIQCGADGLSEDPMASFNLTHVAIAKCVCLLLTWSVPTLLLGGGGYNFPNTAKCWTFLTAMAAGKKLPVDIPEHEHLMEYGPSFELTTLKGNRKDYNTKEHFFQILAKISKNLNSL